MIIAPGTGLRSKSPSLAALDAQERGDKGVDIGAGIVESE